MAAYTAIDDPEAYFQTVLYTGDGAANEAITLPGDTDMQPDLVWIKNRDATDSHCLFDSVRGATKLLDPAENSAETTDADTLDSFTSDGFQVDADVKVNTSSEKYVAWCWKTGTAFSNDASATSVGTLDSAGSINTTSGISIQIVTAEAATDTIAHGLGVAPTVFFIKKQNANDNWFCYFEKGIGNTSAIYFDTTGAPGAGNASWWNNTSPTSSVITIASYTSAAPNLLLCFAEKQGFSKFGTYEGNGDADGTFVYTGFRPAYVLCISIDSTSSRHIFDNKREGYNIDNDALVAEATTVEATADQIDLLSNGFKFRIATDPNVAETYIYLAFAEAPFVNSEGVPCNAR